MMDLLRAKWAKTSTKLLLGAVLGLGGLAVYDLVSEDDCCAVPGAACCYPGSPCCAGKNHLAKQ
jgi:hypothetical protein